MQPSTGSISLTFDDGPDARWTLAVLDALARCGATATFFMLGERVLAEPDAARAVRAAGHDVQLHGHRHVRHTELDEREIELDARQAVAALHGIGVHPTCWRTPWGVRSAANRAVAERLGLTLVDWTLDTHDWRGDPASAMFARAQHRLVPGAVVLMHDALGPGARRDGCQSTVELIEPLVLAARARGLRVQPIGGAPLAHHAPAQVGAVPVSAAAARETAVPSVMAAAS
jgi:peptidoglycan/xylan/chitin deacetylase (PgdA/CDA1 family)